MTSSIRLKCMFLKCGVVVTCLAAALTTGTRATAQSAPVIQTLDYQRVSWATTDTTAVSEDYLGRESLRLKTGEVWRRDLDFQDGTIEFEMAPRPVRSFLGVMFRATEESGRLSYDDVYFRPTASGSWDAVQYEAVTKGLGSWQLYHGSGYTATADIATNQWTRVRIVVAGKRADVFLGDMARPVLRIPELRGPNARGYVGFWGFYPGAKPEDIPSANFAGIEIRSLKVGLAPIPKNAPLPGAITTWRLAQPWHTTDSDDPHIRNAVFPKVIHSDAGLVDLARAFPHSVDGPRLTTVAATTLESTSTRRVGLALAYSDHVRVYLNGALLYAARNVFKLGYPPSMGLVGPDVATVYLPLKKGSNELRLVVAESEDFGWGFNARLAEPAGMPGVIPRGP